MPGKINNVVMVLKRPPGKVFVDILHTAQSRFDKILEIIHIRKKNIWKTSQPRLCNLTDRPIGNCNFCTVELGNKELKLFLNAKISLSL